MKFPSNHQSCVEWVYQGRGLKVSDGLCDTDKDIRLSAWILDFGSTGCAHGGGTVPSPVGQSSAYRGEQGGLLGLLLVLLALKKWSLH